MPFPKQAAAMMLTAALGLSLGCSDQPAAESSASTASSESESQAVRAAAVPEEAADVQPLEVGQSAATATLQRPDGSSVDLADLYADQPTLLIFYRGSWCPYCSTHLSELVELDPVLREMGVQIVAVSPDSPAELSKHIEELELSYQLLSDADLALTRDFGLAFGSDRILLVPAVYIVDREGEIRFAHWNPDYTERLDGEQILEAAREALDR